MVASALCGALIVGGGVAYAYKNNFFGLIGDDRLAGSPPLIQADKSPAKIKPANTESKNADNGGKLIYDRLQTPGEADATAPEERVVARQESVLDTSSIAARLGDDKPDASSAASPSMTGAMMKKEADSPSSEPESQPAGEMDKAGGMTGPRKVKTYQVKPDGTLMKPASPPEAVATQPEPAVPTNISTASIDAAASAPIAALPKPKPEAKRTAALAAPVTAPAVTPADSAASASTQFAVQIAARRTQTDALATFANLQQKFPELLTPYQPLIQKADLGSKGTWYRLRVGPLNDKPSASDLCSKLKTAGLKGCLVRPL